jgi:CHASE3 domain sensor protein
MMESAISPETQLSRLEDARRQTQKQLQIIERQITRRMTAIMPQIATRQNGYRRGKAPDGRTLLERYRANLAGITAERQPELDALAQKLARQDAAIAALRANLSAVYAHHYLSREG